MRVLVLWVLVSGFCTLPATAAQPNVLFIAVDDLRPELGTYGTRAKTPHLDAFAETALRFDRAYCNQAVCGASRVSLMTGLYPEYTGERTFHVTNWRQRWKDTVTLNQHFKANGYTTVGLGKIYHGTSGPGVDPDHWTEWVEVRGGSQYANPESLQATRKSRSSAPGKRTRTRGPATEAGNGGDDVYPDGLRAREGSRRITALAKSGQPFFLAVGFTKPHLPFNAPKKYWDLYEPGSFTMPMNLGVPPGYPDWARNKNAGELRSYSDIPPDGLPTAFSPELNRRLIHGYHACASYMDANVGRLLKALDHAGVADNTIVVFWADHGWKLGDHSSWCKHTNFECDARVPLIIRHPGKTRGATRALVELVDLYPTLCDLCGLDQPAHLQGKSLVPVLDDPKSLHREFAYSSYPHTAQRPRRNVVGHSIRTGHYRYTEWWDAKSDEVVDAVLTNLKDDPGETTNALPEKKGFAKALSVKLRQRVLAVRR